MHFHFYFQTVPTLYQGNPMKSEKFTQKEVYSKLNRALSLEGNSYLTSVLEIFNLLLAIRIKRERNVTNSVFCFIISWYRSCLHSSSQCTSPITTRGSLRKNFLM